MRATAQTAQYTGGGCPLGYTIDENKKYVVDPKHAPTVKLNYDQTTLADKEKSIHNLLKAIEAGMFTESTKTAALSLNLLHNSR